MNYNPAEQEELVGVTLKELLDSARVTSIGLHAEFYEETHRKNLEKAANNLTFYVNKENELPLKMRIFTNARYNYLLYPNSPVLALSYESDSIPSMNGGVHFPEDFQFRNSGGHYPFDFEESGWKNQRQPSIIEARTEYQFRVTRIGDRPTDSPTSFLEKALTIVRYEL